MGSKNLVIEIRDITQETPKFLDLSDAYLHLLCVFACDSAQALYYRALWQFRHMIICTIPTSWPFLDYGNYGCYCGWGGSGTPVDDLDRLKYTFFLL